MSSRFLLTLIVAIASLLALWLGQGFDRVAPLRSGPNTVQEDANPSGALAVVPAELSQHSGDVTTRSACESPRGTLALGRVVDPDGRPVSGARIFAMRSTDAAVVATRTAPDGRFALDARARPSTVLTLVAHSDGWAPAVVERAAAADGTDTEFGDVQLGVGGTLVGAVVDDTGSPNTSARLRLIPAGGTLRRLPPALAAELVDDCRIQADGSFTMVGLPAGPYFVEATAPCRARCRSQRLAVASAQVTPVAPLVLHTGHALRGVVVDAVGAPVAGGTAELVAATGERLVRRATTGEHGDFEFDHLGPGDYHLRIRAGRGPWTLIRDVAVGEVPELIVRLPASRQLSGRVVDAAGDPLPRFELRVRPWAAVTAEVVKLEGQGRDQLAEWSDLAAEDPRHRERLVDAMRGLAAVTMERRRLEREQFPFGIDEPLRATGRCGAFTLIAPPEGTFVFEIAAPGHPVHRIGPISLPSAIAPAGLELRTPDAGGPRLRGRSSPDRSSARTSR